MMFMISNTFDVGSSSSFDKELVHTSALSQCDYSDLPRGGGCLPPALRASPEDISGKMKAGKIAWMRDNNTVL